MSIPGATVNVLSHGSLWALPLALLAGAIAGLNPCCVALYPSAVAVCCGINPTGGCGGSAAKTESGESAVPSRLCLALLRQLPPLESLQLWPGESLDNLVRACDTQSPPFPLSWGFISSGGFACPLAQYHIG